MRNSDESKIKIGILGGSINSAVGRAHISALRLDGNFEISAGCFSRDPKINEISANEYNIPQQRLYPTLEAMLEHEVSKIDLILILTPTNQHFSDISKCLQAGFSIISEKSVACSTEQVKELEAIRSAKNLFAAVIFNYTGYALVRELRERLLSGSIGKLLSVFIEMPQESFRKINNEGLPMKPQDWRLRDYELPTVSLDLGVHVVSLLKFLNLGMPSRILSIQRNHGHFEDLVDEVHGLLEWQNGVVGNLWYGKASLGNRNGLRIRLFGSSGALEWMQIAPDNIHFADAPGNQLKIDFGSPGLLEADKPRYNRFKAGHPTGFIEALANYYHDIAETFTKHSSELNSDSNFVFSLSDACEGLEILKQLHSRE